MILEEEDDYKKRVIQAFKLLGLKTSNVAKFLGIKADTLRRAISRGKVNEAYLIILEKEYGIRKDWIKNGEYPIIFDKDKEISNFINASNSDVLNILENIDKEKILAYLILKENEFIKLDSFDSVIKKLNISSQLRNIANNINEGD